MTFSRFFILFLVGSFLFSLTFISSFGFPSAVATTTDITISAANITSLAALTDTNIPSPTNNQFLRYNFGTSKWIAETVDTTDTNETERVNEIAQSQCPGEVLVGFYSNGTGICETDDVGASGNIKSGDGTYLYNSSTIIYFNYTYARENLNLSSFGISWDGDSDLGGYRLTNVGDILLDGVIYSKDIFPLTDNLYSLGNSTNWFEDLFVENIYSDSINATTINTTNLTSQNINSEDIDSDRINTTNATIGGFDVYKDGDGDMNIDLG